MLDETPNLACFMGWFLRLNLVLSTEFGRLAQRQSIGLTLLIDHEFQIHTNLQPIDNLRDRARPPKGDLTEVVKTLAEISAFLPLVRPMRDEM